MIFPDTLVHRTYGAVTASATGGDTAPAATAGTVLASVQRPSNAETTRWASKGVYAGRNVHDAWWVDTASAVLTLGEPGGQPPDQVDIVDERGVTRAYECVDSKHVRAVIPHYETLVMRVVEGRQ